MEAKNIAKWLGNTASWITRNDVDCVNSDVNTGSSLLYHRLNLIRYGRYCWRCKKPPYDLSQHKQTSSHIIATIANKDGIAQKCGIRVTSGIEFRWVPIFVPVKRGMAIKACERYQRPFRMYRNFLEKKAD